MSANILDPRMIDSTKPLSCVEIYTSFLSATDSTAENLTVTNNFQANIFSTSTLNISTAYANSVLTDIINTTDATVNGLATFNGEVISSFTTTTLTSLSYSFTDADNSKVFHFDTTTQPSITAYFESFNVSPGFNIGIINTGTGIIYLSSDFTPIINAANPFNSVQHSGMFIYRVDEQLFGVGVFE